MFHYGFGSMALDLIINYFSDRYQSLVNSRIATESGFLGFDA
jgi:hypothetical protein